MSKRDELDLKILRALNKKACTASELARIIHASRTTVAYRLETMKEKRLVKSHHGTGVSILWSPIFDRGIGKSSVTVYTGNAFSRGYTAVWKARKGSVVYALYGRHAIREEIRHLSRSFILESQRRIRSRQIVMKSVIHEESISALKGFDDDVLKAHQRHPRGGQYYASSTVFHTASEVMVARSFVLLVDVRRRRSIIIRNREIVTLMWDMARLFFDLVEQSMPTKQFDLEKVIVSMLEQRASRRASSLK